MHDPVERMRRRCNPLAAVNSHNVWRLDRCVLVHRLDGGRFVEGDEIANGQRELELTVRCEGIKAQIFLKPSDDDRQA